MESGRKGFQLAFARGLRELLALVQWPDQVNAPVLRTHQQAELPAVKLKSAYLLVIDRLVASGWGEDRVLNDADSDGYICFCSTYESR